MPALLDNEASFAFKEGDGTLEIITKPHGHGDIHTLLYQSGVAKKWHELGKEWMIFLQDTNALAIRSLPSVLGVSREFDFEMNSVCVPRKPGESMGAICELHDARDNSKIVVNVEYNQLDNLLKEKWNKDGDIKND